MHDWDETGGGLAELFRKARQTDAGTAPSFDRLLVNGKRSRAGRAVRRRRLFAVGFGSAALTTALVLAFAWWDATSEQMPALDPGPLQAQSRSPIEVMRPQSLGVPEPYPPQRDQSASPDPYRFRGELLRFVADLAQNEPSPPPVDIRVPSAEVPVQRREELVERVTVARQEYLATLEKAAQSTEFKGEYRSDLPVPGRMFQNVLSVAPGVHDAGGDGDPDVHTSRDRNFAAEVSGVSNVASLPPKSSFAGLFTAPEDLEQRIGTEPWNTEGYDLIRENEFLEVAENPLSTFSIDVDTASYSNVRRFLTRGQLPPPDAVRIEELINYFDYDYPEPSGTAPFSASVEIADCPWNPPHRLARIGLKGREVSRGEHAGSNLVFLLDVSGSMKPANKLPLLKSAMGLLVDQLTSRDQVAIVVYAGASGLVLDSTSGDSKGKILDALHRLHAGGSTNGGAGLSLAYRVARENFIPGGINRVILATDGDFNIGVTGRGDLLRLIEDDAKKGIFLTALGFGYGNYKDDRLETLADKGNGNYAYIDSLKEARKVLVEEINGTLVTIAKDVKIQIEFNPLAVGAYRLIGYENRMLKKEDFNDDRKDAGEIGAGHTVTALYELVPAGQTKNLPSVDPLKYQVPTAPSEAAGRGEVFTLKLRYKQPEEDTSRLLEFPITDNGLDLGAAADDFSFAAAVAQFGMLLRNSEFKGQASWDSVVTLADRGARKDAHGYRAEFYDLAQRARAMAAAQSRP